MKIVYEKVSLFDCLTIIYHLIRRDQVYVLEPFHAYHHQGKIRFYPKPLSRHVKGLIRRGKISMLSADQLNPRRIYFVSANKAVDIVDIVYPSYKRDYLGIIKFFCSALKSSEAENILRKDLCDQLAVFYSVNNLLCAIKSCFPGSKVKVYIKNNLFSYHYFNKLLLQSEIKTFDSYDVVAIGSMMVTYASNVIKKLFSMVMLISLACMGLIFFAFSRRDGSKNLKKYKFVVTVLSSRQLENNRRRADFLVDENLIKREETVFIPLIPLNADQKRKLFMLKGDVVFLPSLFACVSPVIWFRFVRSALATPYCKVSHDIIYSICRSLMEYFRWIKILEFVKFKNLITHCDFSSSRIARGIALDRLGIKSWYFSDSINFSGLYVSREEVAAAKHPFWTYLKYDNFVTANNFVKDYFCLHPNSIVNSRVVGSIWSDSAGKKTGKPVGYKGQFVISVFDTTYSVNSITSYEEGIIFVQDLIELLKDLSDILILMKEKKDRSLHEKLDPEKGKRLSELYDEIASHPRVRFFDSRADPLDLILSSDMVLSFPFTSPTFEALSIDKPALWHDPLGLYCNTVYDLGIVTHNYKELRNKIKDVQMGRWVYPFSGASPLIDPFRDGKAIERFREVLVENDR